MRVRGSAKREDCALRASPHPNPLPKRRGGGGGVESLIMHTLAQVRIVAERTTASFMTSPWGEVARSAGEGQQRSVKTALCASPLPSPLPRERGWRRIH